LAGLPPLYGALPPDGGPPLYGALPPDGGPPRSAELSRSEFPPRESYERLLRSDRPSWESRGAPLRSDEPPLYGGLPPDDVERVVGAPPRYEEDPPSGRSSEACGRALYGAFPLAGLPPLTPAPPLAGYGL
jgi:hypothetical protein